MVDSRLPYNYINNIRPMYMSALHKDENGPAQRDKNIKKAPHDEKTPTHKEKNVAKRPPPIWRKSCKKALLI